MAIRYFSSAVSDVTYSDYTRVVIAAAQPNTELALAIHPRLIKLFNDLKSMFADMVKDLKVGITDLMSAFASKDMFSLIKAVSFNIQLLYKGVVAALHLIPKGLIKAFEEIEKTGVLKGAKLKAQQVQEFINKYPMLKQLTGIALGGFLLWVWLSMSFVGDPGFDLDVSYIIDAFRGSFNLVDLFLSPAGLTMLTLLATGVFTGIGVSWLGSNLYNLMLALCFTGAKKAKEKGLVDKLKLVIPHKKI